VGISEAPAGAVRRQIWDLLRPLPTCWTSGTWPPATIATPTDEFGASARSVDVHATAEPGPRWPECRDQPPFPPHLREL